MPTAEAPQYTREEKSLSCTAAAAVDKPHYTRDSFSPSCTVAPPVLWAQQPNIQLPQQTRVPHQMTHCGAAAYVVGKIQLTKVPQFESFYTVPQNDTFFSSCGYELGHQTTSKTLLTGLGPTWVRLPKLQKFSQVIRLGWLGLVDRF